MFRRGKIIWSPCEKKVCNKCKLDLLLEYFSKDKSRKDGLSYTCKQCRNKQKQTQRISDPKYLEKQRVYRNKNRDQALESSKKYYKNNKEKKRIYQNKNRKNIRARSRQRENFRLRYDIQYLLAKRLRTRLYLALRREWRSGSAVRDLGCSIQELKEYLESKFQPGMTWGNYGEWHIDHIRPLSSFSLTNKEELLEACHYSNLQPLWAKDNIRKSNYVS